MTFPIEPMAPGERPTEPGWYVTEYTDDHHPVADRRVIQLMRMDEDLWVFDADMPVAEPLSKYEWGFIARIYPDRIEAAGGER